MFLLNQNNSNALDYHTMQLHTYITIITIIIQLLYIIIHVEQ